MSALTHSRQSPQLPPCPSPLLTLYLEKKLSSVSPEGSIPKKRREKGLRTAHTLTPTVWMTLSQVQGPRAYSAEEIYVCEESCQFLLVRKDTGTRKPILSTASEK